MKRSIILTAFVIVMFGGASYYLYAILHTKQPKQIVNFPAEFVERGSNDSIYQAYLQSINNQQQSLTNKQSDISKDEINLKDILYAGFLFIGGALGIMKLWDKKDLSDFKKQVMEVLDNLVQIHADEKNREDIFADLKRIEEAALMGAYTAEIKTLINGIYERARKFCECTMNEDFTSDMLEYAISNIESRSLEARKQVREMNCSQEFKDAFLIIQESNVSFLKLELKKIADDHLHNHKYKRYGDAVKQFLKCYLKEVNYNYIKFEKI